MPATPFATQAHPISKHICNINEKYTKITVIPKRTHARTHKHTQVHTHKYAPTTFFHTPTTCFYPHHTHTCMYTRTHHTHTCMYTRTRTHTCMYAHTHTARTHAPTYARTREHGARAHPLAYTDCNF